MPSVKDMAYNNFNFSDCKMISRTDYSKLVNNGCKPQKDDVVIAKDGSMLKYVFAIQKEQPIVILSSIAILRPDRKKVDSAYLAHYFRQPKIIECTIQNFKTGTGVPRIVLDNFKRIQIYLPCKREQTAIAQILSDMDAKIEQLKKKLSKYQLIKQGMMQELLTGRIRLVNADTKFTDNTVAFPAAKKHSQQFDDAVIIAGIVDAFYSDKYPLGRVKLQKLLYLLRRKEEADISAFKKKAAGPYADSVRYKGGEPIATSSGYIIAEKVDKGTRFAKGPNIGQALGYIQSWGKQPQIDWLVENFQYTGRNDLELFATVDMAMCDLREMGQTISVQSIKQLIHSHKQWKAKLGKAHFSDQDIKRATNKCQELFGNH